MLPLKNSRRRLGIKNGSVTNHAQSFKSAERKPQDSTHVKSGTMTRDSRKL